MTKKPIIIGVGGLLEKDENGRVKDTLKELRDSGFLTYEIRFSRICRNGDTVVCPVSNVWTGDIVTVIDTALQDQNADTSRIGLLGSSLGATMLDEYLASNGQLEGRKVAYAAIAPFARVNPHLRTTLEMLRTKQIDLDMSSDADRENKVRRIIPYSDISTILGIDTPKTLKEMNKSYLITPLTIYGAIDERGDVKAIEERHRLLGGKEDNLVKFDKSGHNVPYEDSIKIAKEFLQRELLG